MEPNLNVSEPNPRVESKTFLADVHYFISVPEDKPLHSRFEKGQVIRIDTLLETTESRISFIDSSDSKSCSLTGSLSLIQPEYDERQETCVRVELDYGEDLGASLEWDWMIQAHNLRNDGLQNYRPFCLDIYFWTRAEALLFLEEIKAYQQGGNESSQITSLEHEATHLELFNDDDDAAISYSDDPVQDVQDSNITLVQRGQQSNVVLVPQDDVSSPDEDEILKMNIVSLKCINAENSELQALNNAKLKCRIMQNRLTNDMRLLISNIFDYGTISLTYILSKRSFPYQLPDFTVQVRFLNVEKTIQSTNPEDDRLKFARDAQCLDSPIFRFEHQADALMFQEALRKEKMVYNGIVQWLRSSSNTNSENSSSTIGIDITGSFTCVDDRRIQLWETEQGFVKIMFHRQFHLVTTYVRPCITVEQELGTSLVKISNLKIRFIEGLPKYDVNDAAEMSGLDVTLKCKFLSPENAHLFMKAIIKYRDSTINLFPENERPQNPNTANQIGLSASQPPQPPITTSSQQAFFTSLPPPPPLQHMNSYQNVNQAIYASNSNPVQPYTMPPPPPPMSNLGRRAPAPPQLYQIPSQRFVQAPMPSPRNVFTPQSPLSMTFQTQPLSPYTPAMSPQSIYSNPPPSIMNGMSPSGSMPLNAYFPPTVPTSPNPQAHQTHSPVSPKHSHTSSFSHMRQNSLVHEPTSIVAELPADVPTPVKADVITPTKEILLEDTESDFTMERVPTGLGGNVPINSTTPVKHQNSISVSKMFRKLR